VLTFGPKDREDRFAVKRAEEYHHRALNAYGKRLPAKLSLFAVNAQRTFRPETTSKLSPQIDGAKSAALATPPAQNQLTINESLSDGRKKNP
jgi:hypothetical protein